MKSLTSYLWVIIAIMYWIFRIAISLMDAMKLDFICAPLNSTYEIVLLFLTIPFIIMIIRRNLIGTTLYFATYAGYFGTIVYNSLVPNASSNTELCFTDLTSIIISALGVIIPTLILLDVLIQKSGYHPESKDSDWYYKNEKYDRKFDERVDRNQYKIK